MGGGSAGRNGGRGRGCEVLPEQSVLTPARCLTSLETSGGLPSHPLRWLPHLLPDSRRKSRSLHSSISTVLTATPTICHAGK